MHKQRWVKGFGDDFVLQMCQPKPCTSEQLLISGSPRPSTEPKNPKPRKVSKKVSREGFGTPDPGPPKKFPKKSEVKKRVKINYFLDFSDFLGNFLGGPGSGVPRRHPHKVTLNVRLKQRL